MTTSSNPTITIRTVDPSSSKDLQDFKQMTRKYLEWLNEDLCFQGIEEELAGLPGCYSPEVGGYMLLAEMGDPDNVANQECVGAVALRPLEGKQEEGVIEVCSIPVSQICEMKRLFVLPEYHGKGIGKALAKGILAEAQRLGYKAIVLDTLERLKGANRLYRSMGFQNCAPYNHCPLPGVLYFFKSLSAAEK